MLNERLNKIRKNRAIKQQKMANSINVALRTYQEYEEGSRKPKLETLVKIGDVLDVSVDYLLCRDEFMKSHGRSPEDEINIKPS